jgi:hypothetical protein
VSTMPMRHPASCSTRSLDAWLGGCASGSRCVLGTNASASASTPLDRRVLWCGNCWITARDSNGRHAPRLPSGSKCRDVTPAAFTSTAAPDTGRLLSLSQIMTSSCVNYRSDLTPRRPWAAGVVRRFRPRRRVGTVPAIPRSTVPHDELLIAMNQTPLRLARDMLDVRRLSDGGDIGSLRRKSQRQCAANSTTCPVTTAVLPCRRPMETSRRPPRSALKRTVVGEVGQMGEEAAVDRDHETVQVLRAVAAQEGDDVGNVGRFPEAG